MPDSRIELVKADISTLDVDAIVNAANESLAPGGGVCGAIHRAAGPQLAKACAELPLVRPGVRCPVGQARLTPGFDLPARFVIHAVGPIYRDGASNEPALLASAYRESLILARRNELASIAFPAISTGIFAYPVGEACEIALREVKTHLEADTTLARVVLCCFDDATLAEYRRRQA
ncbi:MAG: O-acetyl-ADP-ribose deacetylase [Phycisphaerales bacterium]